MAVQAVRLDKIRIDVVVGGGATVSPPPLSLRVG